MSKMTPAYEAAAAAVSNATSAVEAAKQALAIAAAKKNQGFLPPDVREGFPRAIEALDALFAALSNAQ